MKNYYNILEVSENASKEIIEKAYKVLVMRYHPDLQANNPKAEAKIREINEAYSVLSDSFMREQYDKELKKEREKLNKDNYDELIYGRLYRDKERQRFQEKEQEHIKTYNNTKKETIGSYKGIIEIIKSIFEFKSKIGNIKEIRSINILALILTILIIICIGLILYCIPFTHDWMYKNFLDTPLTSWMFK